MSDFAFQKEEVKPKNQEIEQLEQEIAAMYRKRKKFLLFGLLLIILGVGVAIPLAFVPIEGLYIIPANMIAAGIVLLILRGALFNARIRNRKARIQALSKQ